MKSLKLRKNKKIILSALLALLVLTPRLVLADWGVPGVGPGDGKYHNVTGDFDTAVTNATNWLLGFTAMIAVLVIVWGGINYIGSAGDEEKARTAKRTITYGLLGLLVAGLAYAIVKVIVVTIL